MKATSKTTFGKYITKGRKYDIIQDTGNMLLLRDDSGEFSGWAKSRFTLPTHLELYGWELNTKEL